MSTRSAAVAAAIAILGIAVVLLLRQGGPAVPGAPAATVLAAAVNLPVDAVERIALERPGEKPLVFERRGQAWVQVEPFGHPMDGFSIRQLAVNAAHAEVQRRLEPGEIDKGDLQLEGIGRATLRCSWPAGEVVLTFGRRGVAGRWYLATPSDGAVYVAAGDFYERAVEMDPKEWRDRTLFSGDLAEIESIEIAQGPQPLKLERRGRAWMMAEPHRTRADEMKLNALLSALGRAKTGGFIADQPEDVAPFGLAEPAARLTVRFAAAPSAAPGGPSSECLLVGDRMAVNSEDRFGMIEGRPVVVRLPEALLRAVFPKALDLVAATGSGVHAADVKAIVVRGPDGDLRLERDLDRWIAPDRGGAEVATRQVEALLELLTARRADEVRVDPARRFSTIVTLYGFDGKPKDTVRIDRDEEGRLLIENGDGILRYFPKEVPAPLTAAAFSLSLE